MDRKKFGLLNFSLVFSDSLLDGSVYTLMSNGCWEGIGTVKLKSGLAAFYPENINERVDAQEGCFTSFPLPEAGFEVKPLTEENYEKDIECINSVIVPAKHKRDIRRQLSRLGSNQRTIYPALEGVAKWVRSSLALYIV